MTFILHPHSAQPDSPLGGKARALAHLSESGFVIPAWFVVSPEAFHRSLGAEDQTTLESAQDAASIRAVVEKVYPAPEVEAELQKALEQLCSQGELVAVRSSASDEDGAEHSFAGQLDSFLFVPLAEVPGKVAAVWRSGFSERIVAYRKEHGLPLTPRPPAVLVQRMVQADAAGVAFSADPVSGRRGVAVVSAVFGLGSALVSGEADADTYRVDRDGTIGERSIVEKKSAHRADPSAQEGVSLVNLPSDRVNMPAINDEQARAVAEMARRTARHFGRPQDIEWAIEAGQLYLLQSRPITSLARMPDPDGELNIWDNSNIAESYSGVTTPMTFSFIRFVYENVYRQFCRMMRVPEEKIEAHNDIFSHMLGLVRGRVYYNLLNWYRLIALLPGYEANRGFMEQMMGVKEPLPDHLAKELGESTWLGRLRDRFRLMGSVLALVRQHFSIDRQIRRFYARLRDALGEGRPDLSGLRPDELVAHYRNLERKLLTRWDAPLVNDFLAMIFYGVLGKLTRKWCGDEDGTLQNDLLCGEGGMISAEPAARVRSLAEVAAQHPDLTSTLVEGSLAQIHSAIARVPEFEKPYREYLDKFGDRCLEELKLESPTLFDDPLTLLRSIGQFAQRLRSSEEGIPTSIEAEIRRAAEERVQKSLGWRPLRRLTFWWVLRNARARVRDRENLRFERTRLFGRIRELVLELGRKLYALDRLDDARDVFYLELDEVLGVVDGTATTTDLRGLVAVRKAEFARYRESAPADRFETRGIVHAGHTFEGKTREADLVEGEQLKGLGCCPGVVRGPVRVIRDPRNAVLKTGEILVAERTDPGWIMLFPAASGLLVERGSLLSHSAIVAREMAIPAIVSIAGVTRWLKDGDQVEMNGSTGIVRRVES